MLMTFSTTTSIIVGIIFLILFSLSVQMAEGATFSVVPFINKKAIGSVSGIVGAGGNVGAFLAAMLLKSQSAVAEKAAIVANQGLGEETIKAAQSAASATAVSSGYFIIGTIVVVTAVVSLTIRFSSEDEKVAQVDSIVTSDGLIPIKVKS
jgi:NNP family nitrate/nitrite transporter-like MFS transporter